MSTATLSVTPELVAEIRKKLLTEGHQKVRAWLVVQELEQQGIKNVDHKEVGELLNAVESGEGQHLLNQVEPPKPEVKERKSMKETVEPKPVASPVPDELKPYIPKPDDYAYYVEREEDKDLALNLETGKHVMLSGPQGTGKSTAPGYYASQRQRPFFVVPITPEFNLTQLFAQKTIKNGSITSIEGIFLKHFTSPSVILFDEVNAASNSATYAFHTMLANRFLFVQEGGENCEGKVYHMHPECKVVFAQNPKSSKYIGGHVKSSAFLGRLTHLTYPALTHDQVEKAINVRYQGKLKADDVKRFAMYYKGCTEMINQNSMPIDISIRQILNIIDLFLAGMPLGRALDCAVANLTEASSQPQLKQSFRNCAATIWKSEMK